MCYSSETLNGFWLHLAFFFFLLYLSARRSWVLLVFPLGLVCIYRSYGQGITGQQIQSTIAEFERASNARPLRSVWNLCIPCINVRIVQWQRAHRVHSDLDAVTERIYTCWNCGVTNIALAQEDRPHPLWTPACLENNKYLGYESRADLKSAISVLARASSNLTESELELL
jgi:hypothetical protein